MLHSTSQQLKKHSKRTFSCWNFISSSLHSSSGDINNYFLALPEHSTSFWNFYLFTISLAVYLFLKHFIFYHFPSSLPLFETFILHHFLSSLPLFETLYLFTISRAVYLRRLAPLRLVEDPRARHVLEGAVGRRVGRHAPGPRGEGDEDQAGQDEPVHASANVRANTKTQEWGGGPRAGDLRYFLVFQNRSTYFFQTYYSL